MLIPEHGAVRINWERAQRAEDELAAAETRIAELEELLLEAVQLGDFGSFDIADRITAALASDTHHP